MESFWDPLQALEFSVAARLPSFGFIPRRPRRPNRPSRPLRPRRPRRSCRPRRSRRPRRPRRPRRHLRPRRSRRPRRHRRHFLWFPGHVLLHAHWCPLRGIAVGLPFATPILCLHLLQIGILVVCDVTKSHAAILAKGVTRGVEVSHRCRSLQWHG